MNPSYKEELRENQLNVYRYTVVEKNNNNKVFTIHSLEKLGATSIFIIGNITYQVWSVDGYTLTVNNLNEKAIVAYKIVK